MKNNRSHIESDKQLKQHYKLNRVLGQGCFGIVYEAVAVATGKTCALKLEPLKVKNKNTLAKEYNALQELQGLPGIPRAYRYGSTSSYYYLELELLKTDIGTICDKTQRFQVGWVCRLGARMLQILEGVHKKGIVHRDLKPQNFMFDSSNKLYLIDFGISTKLNLKPDSNRKTSFVGTPRYASKNAHMNVELGPKDDIQSMLYILIYLANKHLPWIGIQKDSKRSQLTRILEVKKTTTIEELCMGLPPCFYETFKYITSAPPQIDYNYLRQLFHQQYTILETTCFQDNLPTASVIPLLRAKSLTKEVQQFKSRSLPADITRMGQIICSSSIEVYWTPTMMLLTVPSAQQFPTCSFSSQRSRSIQVFASNCSQITSNLSSDIFDQNLQPSDSVANRMQSLKTSRNSQRFGVEY